MGLRGGGRRMWKWKWRAAAAAAAAGLWGGGVEEGGIYAAGEGRRGGEGKGWVVAVGE